MTRASRRNSLSLITGTLRQLPGRFVSQNPFHSKRRILGYALLASVLSLLLLALRPPILNEANQVARDRVFRWRESPRPYPNVAVVAIDQPSVEAMGRWPWSRSLQARLIEQLKEAKVGTIALDIAYLHPESPGADQALVDVLQSGGSPVVGGYFFRAQSSADRAAEPGGGRQLDLLARLKLDAIHSATAMPADIDATTILRQATFAFPHVEVVQPSIARHLAALGFFNILPEQDGRVRKLPLVIRHGESDTPDPDMDRYYPALTLQALAVYLSSHRDVPRDLQMEAEGEIWLPFREIIDLKIGHEGLMAIQLGDRLIPVDHHGQFNLNFYQPPDTGGINPMARAEAADPAGILLPNQTGIPFISAATLLNDDPDISQAIKQTLAGKLVFVGLTEQGLADFQPTPVAQQFPGVAIQATAAANILAQQYLSHGSNALLITVLITAILPFTTVFVLARTRKPIFIGLVGIIALLLPLAWFLYMALVHSTLLGFIYPTLGVVLGVFCFSAYYVRNSQEKTRHLVDGFARFLSPELVDEFLTDPRWRNLDTEREPEIREVTVLFSDIRGFTGIAEKLSSAGPLFKLLNSYLGAMATLVKQHNGHLDKFIGDAVMAIYNAPLHQPDHPVQAARTALAMQTHLAAKINPRFQEEYDGIDLRVGIGLHTGEVSVGNVGNDHHLEYTALGDAVNQASRLEGATKTYGVQILITDATRRQLASDFVCRKIDTVIFKGKEQPTTIYELMSDHLEPTLQDLKDAYEAALQHYRNRDFETARQAFSTIAENPASRDDGPSWLMIERCLKYSQIPPPENWNGVERLEEK